MVQETNEIAIYLNGHSEELVSEEIESDDCYTSISQKPVNPLALNGSEYSDEIALPTTKMIADKRFWQNQSDDKNVNSSITNKISSEDCVSSSCNFFSDCSRKSRFPMKIQSWYPKLYKKQLCICGVSNGKIVQKIVVSRVSQRIFNDNCKDVCCLYGSILGNGKVPNYIRAKFKNGIPINWEQICKIWQKFLSSGSPDFFVWDANSPDSSNCSSMKQSIKNKQCTIDVLQRKVLKLQRMLKISMIKETVQNKSSSVPPKRTNNQILISSENKTTNTSSITSNTKPPSVEVISFHSNLLNENVGNFESDDIFSNVGNEVQDGNDGNEESNSTMNGSNRLVLRSESDTVSGNNVTRQKEGEETERLKNQTLTEVDSKRTKMNSKSLNNLGKITPLTSPNNLGNLTPVVIEKNSSAIFSPLQLRIVESPSPKKILQTKIKEKPIKNKQDIKQENTSVNKKQIGDYTENIKEKTKGLEKNEMVSKTAMKEQSQIDETASIKQCNNSSIINSSFNLSTSRRGRTRCNTLPFWQGARFETKNNECFIVTDSEQTLIDLTANDFMERMPKSPVKLHTKEHENALENKKEDQKVKQIKKNGLDKSTKHIKKISEMLDSKEDKVKITSLNVENEGPEATNYKWIGSKDFEVLPLNEGVLNTNAVITQKNSESQLESLNRFSKHVEKSLKKYNENIIKLKNSGLLPKSIAVSGKLSQNAQRKKTATQVVEKSTGKKKSSQMQNNELKNIVEENTTKDCEGFEILGEGKSQDHKIFKTPLMKRNLGSSVNSENSQIDLSFDITKTTSMSGSREISGEEKSQNHIFKTPLMKRNLRSLANSELLENSKNYSNLDNTETQEALCLSIGRSVKEQEILEEKFQDDKIVKTSPVKLSLRNSENLLKTPLTNESSKRQISSVSTVESSKKILQNYSPPLTRGSLKRLLNSGKQVTTINNIVKNLENDGSFTTPTIKKNLKRLVQSETQVPVTNLISKRAKKLLENASNSLMENAQTNDLLQSETTLKENHKKTLQNEIKSRENSPQKARTLKNNHAELSQNKITETPTLKKIYGKLSQNKITGPTSKKNRGKSSRNEKTETPTLNKIDEKSEKSKKVDSIEVEKAEQNNEKTEISDNPVNRTLPLKNSEDNKTRKNLQRAVKTFQNCEDANEKQLTPNNKKGKVDKQLETNPSNNFKIPVKNSEKTINVQKKINQTLYTQMLNCSVNKQQCNKDSKLNLAEVLSTNTSIVSTGFDSSVLSTDLNTTISKRGRIRVPSLSYWKGERLDVTKESTIVENVSSLLSVEDNNNRTCNSSLKQTGGKLEAKRRKIDAQMTPKGAKGNNFQKTSNSKKPTNNHSVSVNNNSQQRTKQSDANNKQPAIAQDNNKRSKQIGSRNVNDRSAVLRECYVSLSRMNFKDYFTKSKGLKDLNEVSCLKSFAKPKKKKKPRMLPTDPLQLSKLITFKAKRNPSLNSTCSETNVTISSSTNSSSNKKRKLMSQADYIIEVEKIVHNVDVINDDINFDMFDVVSAVSAFKH